MQNEIWLPIKYGNGKKEISNYGNVRNALTKKILKSYTAKRNGYKHISFFVSKEVGSKTFKIHRLVAEAFLLPVKNKTHVNHIDFDKTNNNVSNLEWCTIYENIQHYFREKYNHIITDEIVKYIRQNIEIIGARKLSKQLNLSEGYVYGVANGIHCKNIYPELIREKRTSFPIAVIKYDLNGLELERYNSISQAAKANNAKLSYIQRALSGERGHYKGFIYKSDGYKKIPDIKKEQRLIKLREMKKSKTLNLSLDIE